MKIQERAVSEKKRNGVQEKSLEASKLREAMKTE
jgi:hypothetical protein